MTRFRSVRYALLTGAWIVLTGFISVLNLVFSPMGQASAFSPLLPGAFLAALTVPFVLIWRRRLPEIILIITVAAGVLLPIGATTSWVALGGLFRWRESRSGWKDPWLWAGTAAVAITTYLAVWRDLRTSTADGSLLGSLLTGPTPDPWRQALPWYTAELLTLIMLAMVLGASTLVRAQTRLSQTTSAVAKAQSQNVDLHRELARREERNHISREIHDAVGNKLATVSMLAGAMQVSIHDEAEVREQARQLQKTAVEAVHDMHSIIETLRGDPEPFVPLSDLHRLVDDANRAGSRVEAVIQINHPHLAPAPVARAIHRIVQEVTTNAAKHAPGAPLWLKVVGGPGGIEIAASNPLIPPSSVTPGSRGESLTGGFGLIGVAERVEQLGGWLRYGPRDGAFALSATIPWNVAGHP